MTDMIRASGLVKRYKEVEALAGLDLVVPEGKVLALLGPNGAGKTTAVKCLTTLIRPDAGTAEVAGVDVLKDPVGVRARIGLSGQYAAVDEHLTAYENLVMIGRLYHLGKARAQERARELLEMSDLTEFADRPSKTYSGGQRRRLDLAGALVAEPPVLVLDEPTTGLDVRSRQQMWDVIKDLVAGGSTLLLTTQYLEEADRLADEILVIDHGRSIAQGTADELKARTGGERIEVVLADTEDRESAVRVMSEVAASEVRVSDNGRELGAAVRGSGTGDLLRVLQGFERETVTVLDVGLRRPTLDDVFLALTGHIAEESDQDGKTSDGDHSDKELKSMTTQTPQKTTQSIASALSDGWVVAQRNIIKIKRVPDILVFVLISPIMFVLLFAYVFGGAIDVPGDVDYKEFLVPGIFAQTVVFGATFTGYGLADDMQKGIIDRFRSLPMSRSAVLVGRTTSDVVYNVLSLIIMGLTGLLVGWRIREGLLDALLGFLLLLVFAYAISWIMAYVGLLVPSVEVVNNASFIVIFPLTFVSNAFVPQESFSGPLKVFVEWNPVSTVTQACRELFGNTDPSVAVPDSWAMQNPALYTLLWAAAIVAVFAPIAARQYRLSTSK